MDNERVQKVCLGIMELGSIEEIRAVNDVLTARWSAIRNAESALVKPTLTVGDMVAWDSRKHGRTYVGKLVKKNRTRGVVFIDGTRWTVPFSMLRKEVQSP